MSPRLLGALIIALPAILLAWTLLWRRHRSVYWFAVVLIGVGVGYLMATGATDDVARALLPQLTGPAPVRAR